MIRGTTIVGVKHKGQVALAGDGQVTFAGNTIMKHTAKKVRRLYGDKVVAGFAGSVADAFTLFEKFEAKLEEFHGNITRSAVEVAKEWRRDKYLTKLEALMIVADRDHMLIISGSGEVIDPDDGVAAIGSGGSYALAAAKAMLKHSHLDAQEIARESLAIAASICVFTNQCITVEVLEG